MNCYCNHDLEKLKKEYGRMNRAHTTIMAALVEFRISHPSSADQISHAVDTIRDCEERLKTLIRRSE